MDTILNFVYAGGSLNQECHFCRSMLNVHYWARIAEQKRSVPACAKCIVSFIKDEVDAKPS